jgi:hypothetical protein
VGDGTFSPLGNTFQCPLFRELYVEFFSNVLFDRIFKLGNWINAASYATTKAITLDQVKIETIILEPVVQTEKPLFHVLVQNDFLKVHNFVKIYYRSFIITHECFR